MHCIEWTEKYATGVEIIDSQHQRIFKYLQQIDEAIKLRCVDTIEDIIIGLLDYAISHNSFEEQLMLECDYPQLHDHRMAHDAFRRRTEDYIRRLSSGENRLHLAHQVRADIAIWLNGHIMYEDMAYVPYMKKQPDAGLVASLLSRFFGKHSNHHPAV